jgi:RNA-directed DNA polymerase
MILGSTLHSVICCELEGDAKRIRESLTKRLAKFKLQLNEGKTKMVNFSKKKARMGILQETFDFLGFTFYWGLSRGKRVIPKLKTKSKTLKTKLKKVEQWIKSERNKSKLRDIWKTFCSKMRGHIQYYGISHNCKSVGKFLYESRKKMFKWLNKRSQKKSFNWEKFNLFIERHPMPEAKIVHRLF